MKAERCMYYYFSEKRKDKKKMSASGEMKISKRKTKEYLKTKGNEIHIVYPINEPIFHITLAFFSFYLLPIHPIKILLNF